MNGIKQFARLTVFVAEPLANALSEPAMRRHLPIDSPPATRAIIPNTRVSMQPQPQPAGPVSLSERILFIDVLRGMALFGILAANMRAFFAPLDAYGYIGVLFHSRADILAQAFVDTFIQGKFI